MMNNPSNSKHKYSFLKYIIDGVAIVISITALVISIRSCGLSEDIYKAKEIPRLNVIPLRPYFYQPKNPEVPGQVKFRMAVDIQNLSDAVAKDVSINFETKDWYDHSASLFKEYKRIKHPRPIISTLPAHSTLPDYGWQPDVPSSGEKGFISQDKPFSLKVTLRWNDINEKQYVFVGFYALKHYIALDGQSKLYFNPKETFDSVIHGKDAWKALERNL